MTKTKRTIKFWTPEELELFKTGKSDAEIATITGRTAGAVSVKRSEVKRNGVKLRAHITKGTSSTVKQQSPLNFIIQGIPVTVDAKTAKSVYIGANRIEVKF